MYIQTFKQIWIEHTVMNPITQSVAANSWKNLLVYVIRIFEKIIKTAFNVCFFSIYTMMSFII